MSSSPSHSARTALILGANGRFGVAAAGAFVAAGWRVIAALRRDPDPAMPRNVRITRVALDQTEQLASEAAGANVVVHALNPTYTQWAKQAMPLVRSGLAVAERLGARFYFPGNVYNFGEAMPPTLVEDTPQRGTGKGALRIAMEEEIERWCARGQVRATIIRAGDYFGGGTGNWFDLVIVKRIRRGKLVYPGPTNVAHAWAYLPDLARAFVAAAERSPERCSAFERFHFAGHSLTGDKLLEEIARAAMALGIAPARGWSRGTFPWRLLRVGGRVVPLWRELAEIAYLWRIPHALDGTALEQAVGPLRTTPLESALRHALAALGLTGRSNDITTEPAFAPSTIATSMRCDDG